jgi:hypothetical protein
MFIKLQDSHNSTIKIHLGGFLLPSKSNNSLNIDCVSLYPRFQHNLGFSNLIDTKSTNDSTMIKKLIIEINHTNQVRLLL